MKKTIVNEKNGIHLETLLEFVKLKIETLRELGHPFSVSWHLSTYAYGADTHRLRFRQVWKDDGNKEDVFNSKNNINLKSVLDTIVSDIEVTSERCELGEWSSGDLLFKNTEDFSLELPLYFISTPTIVHYKYAICKDETYKEMYDAIFS